MNALVGYTGFVGSNIYNAGEFDFVYNSKNIEEAYGLEPDLLVYAGLRAEKYLANMEPEKDMELILQAQTNISEINPKKIVLISTIDVFDDANGVDENSVICTENLHAYGYNRYKLELWVRENYPDALIIRLPGLFGKNIKKNFIYDYMNIIPFMLKEQKMDELSVIDNELKDFYILLSNGFYKVRELTGTEKEVLKIKFQKIGFSALNFTDSRSVYQFYNLERLWDDIQIALENNLRLWHPATEPISAGQIYEYLTGKIFVNEISDNPVIYNFKTIHADIFAGKDNYICDKEEVLRDIRRFVKGADIT